MDAEASISKLCWSYINRFMEIFAFREFCKLSFQFTESIHKDIELSTANTLFYSGRGCPACRWNSYNRGRFHSLGYGLLSVNILL